MANFFIENIQFRSDFPFHDFIKKIWVNSSLFLKKRKKEKKEISNIIICSIKE